MRLWIGGGVYAKTRMCGGDRLYIVPALTSDLFLFCGRDFGCESRGPLDEAGNNVKVDKISLRFYVYCFCIHINLNITSCPTFPISKKSSLLPSFITFPYPNLVNSILPSFESTNHPPQCFHISSDIWRYLNVLVLERLHLPVI